MTSISKPSESRMEEAEQALSTLLREITIVSASKYGTLKVDEFPALCDAMLEADRYYRKYYGKEP